MGARFRIPAAVVAGLLVGLPAHAKKNKGDKKGTSNNSDELPVRILPGELEPDLSELDAFEEPDEAGGPDAEPDVDTEAMDPSTPLPTVDLRPLLPDVPEEEPEPTPAEKKITKKEGDLPVRIVPATGPSTGGRVLTPDDLAHLGEAPSPKKPARKTPVWVQTLLGFLAEPDEYALDQDPSAVGASAADEAFGAYERDPIGISTAVADLVPEFEICLDEHGDSLLGSEGAVKLRFDIEKNGSIGTIQTEGSTSVDLDGCFKDSLAALWFERGRIETPVEIPLQVRVD